MEIDDMKARVTLDDLLAELRGVEGESHGKPGSVGSDLPGRKKKRSRTAAMRAGSVRVSLVKEMVEAAPMRDSVARGDAVALMKALIAALKKTGTRMAGRGGIWTASGRDLGPAFAKHHNLVFRFAPFGTQSGHAKRGAINFVTLGMIPAAAEDSESSHEVGLAVAKVLETNARAREIFVHEVIHYTDSLRGLPSRKSISMQGSTYYQDPAEFNAWYQQGVLAVDEELQRLKSMPVNRAFYGEFGSRFGDNPQAFVRMKAQRYWRNDFINALGPKYRRKFVSRAAALWMHIKQELGLKDRLLRKWG